MHPVLNSADTKLYNYVHGLDIDIILFNNCTWCDMLNAIATPLTTALNRFSQWKRVARLYHKTLAIQRAVVHSHTHVLLVSTSVCRHVGYYAPTDSLLTARQLLPEVRGSKVRFTIVLQLQELLDFQGEIERFRVYLWAWDRHCSVPSVTCY